MMTLYSGTTDPFSQRCRQVVYEKQVDCRIVDVDLESKPEELAIMNPYQQFPILVERDLVLYESNIINEYIDARYLNPQLMPDDPKLRATTRMGLFRFEKELFANIEAIETGSQKSADRGRGIVRDNLAQLAPAFVKQKFILGDKFSMLDVAIGPLLWRLDHYDVKMPANCAPLIAYAQRLFERPAFIEALTPSERAMRQ